MEKEMWLWTRTGEREIILKNLTHFFSTGAIQCSSWEEVVDVNAVTGQYRRKGGRGGAAAKYKPLQCFPRAKTHFSHTVRDVVEGETCPDSVCTPVRLKLPSVLYVLQTQTGDSHTRTERKARNKSRYFCCWWYSEGMKVVGHKVFFFRLPSRRCIQPEPACEAHLIIHDFM